MVELTRSEWLTAIQGLFVVNTQGLIEADEVLARLTDLADSNPFEAVGVNAALTDVPENHIPMVGAEPARELADSGLEVSDGVVSTSDIIRSSPTGAQLGPSFQLGNGMQSLQLTYGDGTKALAIAREYDDNGSANLFSYNLQLAQNFPINSANTQALTDPQEFSYTTTADTLIINFTFIPNETGTLRLQVWSGTDDTGGVLFDQTREVTAGEVGNQTLFDDGNDYISPAGSTVFVRLSGIALRGGTGVSGDAMEGSISPFLVGRVQPYTLDAVDPQLLSGTGIRINSNPDGTQLTVTNTAEEIVPIGAGARDITTADESKLLFFDNTADTPLTLPSRIGVTDDFAVFVQANNRDNAFSVSGQSGETIRNLTVQPAVDVPTVSLSANVEYRIQAIAGASGPGTVWHVLGLGGAAGDITPAQIKSLYESNPNTNAFEDAEKTKLGNLDGLPNASDAEWPFTSVATYADLAGTHRINFNAYNRANVDNIVVISHGIVLPNSNLTFGTVASFVDVTITAGDAGQIGLTSPDPVIFEVQLRDDENAILATTNFGQVEIGTGVAGSDSTAIHDNVAGEITAITAKAVINDNDRFIIEDSEDGNSKKHVTRATVLAGATGTEGDDGW